MDHNKIQPIDEKQTLNIDFPALPQRPQPPYIVRQTLPIISSRLRDQGLKRSFDDSQAETQEIFTEPLCQTDNGTATVLKKKVIKLSYREPKSSLESLPSLPSLSSLPSIDLADFGVSIGHDKQVSPNGGLESLDATFNNATLDSLTASQDSIDSMPSHSTSLTAPHSSHTSQSFKLNNAFENNIPNIDNTDVDNCNQKDTNDYCEEQTTQILKKFKGCKKNRGHDQFSLVKDLKVCHLPREIQHEDALTFLSCMARLVVQITVTSTSAGRESGDDYQDLVGTDKKRFGSGFIHSVDEDILRFRCKQKNCPQYRNPVNDSGFFSPESCISPVIDNSTSPTTNDNSISLSTTLDRSESNISTNSNSSITPKKKHYFYGGLNIHTNRHIIYDKSEADNAIVKFFFDTPDGQGTIEGHVGAIIGVNSFQDHVILHVMSHDKSLFQQVDKCLQDARSSYRQMLQSTVHMQCRFAKSTSQSWIAVVSHPHGLAKHVSFGHVQKEEVEERRVKKYYDAGTCPGSSGGLVITPSLLELQWPGAVHRMYDKNTRLNVTWDSRYPDLKTKDMERIHKRVVRQKRTF